MSNKKEIPYIRVGTTYYKIIEQPFASGLDTVKMLKQWDKETINFDHAKNYIHKIPKYDGFCLIPSNKNYKQVIGTFYNKYEPFIHKSEKGECPKILNFLKHIFGEQLNLGLDYFTLLYLQPLQKLPILCLVSQERNTGKTTFLKLLKEIFTKNMTINTNDDFKSNFNSEWATKLIIGVDETFLDKKQDSERLKNLSTATFYKSEAKGKDRIEMEFFAKFVLCSNNEDSFIKIDDDETRYWIRKIPKLQYDNINLSNELKKEIPFFLYYLENRQLSTVSTSRMWFSTDEIWTKELDALKKANRSSLELELEINIIESLKEFELEEISFSYKDLIEMLKNSGIRNVTKNQISKVIKNKWQIPMSDASTYQKYYWCKNNEGKNFIQSETEKARIFKFTREFFKIENKENNEIDKIINSKKELQNEKTENIDNEFYNAFAPVEETPF